MSDLLERMEAAWMDLSRRSFDSVDAGIDANLCQEAMDEISRLREAKQAALKIADERSKENVLLRTLLRQARQFVADAGFDDDNDVTEHSSALLAAIEQVLTSNFSNP